MPNRITARMSHGNPQNNQVTLPNPIVVKQGEEIFWDPAGSNIEAFCLESKSGSNIFTTSIPTSMSSRLTLQVAPDAPPGNWKYSIYWRQGGDAPSTRRPDDPVIAVRPATTPYIRVLLMVTTVILASLMMKLFFDKKKRRKHRKN